MSAALYDAEIMKALKTHGLMMHGPAFTALRLHLQSTFGSSFASSSRAAVRAALSSLLSNIAALGLQSSVLTIAQLSAALAAQASEADMMMSNGGGGGGDASSSSSSSSVVPRRNVVDVIQSVDMPRFHYDSVRKIFVHVSHTRTKFGVADEKADMLRARWELIAQRLARLPAFQVAKNNENGTGDENEAQEISSIESLMGTSGRKCIFGQLSQLTEGFYSLEDLHSHIRVDLSAADLNMSSGLFTEGCMVLLEGVVTDNGTFKASTLISPPAEMKSKSILTFPTLDWLGSSAGGAESSRGGLSTAARERALSVQHAQHVDDHIIILSDVHLDQAHVMTALASMFSVLVHYNPTTFVFMGNFSSAQFSNQPGEIESLRSHFDALADLIAKYPTLCANSHFVFIPGPADLPGCMAPCMPLSPLPSMLTAKLRDKIARVTFGSNPCRLSWLQQELVFYREDLLHKMCRNCIRPSSESETSDLSQHLVKTILDQSHLCPLMSDKRPIYWNLDHAMRLYPLPDVLVLADCVDQYEWPYEGVKAINPGGFAHDYAFVVYKPGQDKVEFSKVTQTATKAAKAGTDTAAAMA